MKIKLKFEGEIEITGFEEYKNIRKNKDGDEYRKFTFFGIAKDFFNEGKTREYVVKFNANTNYQPVWIQAGKKVTLKGFYIKDEYNGLPYEQIEIDEKSIIAAGLAKTTDFKILRKRVSGFGKDD